MTTAELRENLLVAMDTLRSHKVRSGLTILGIVIGVTSVISVAAIIDGLNAHVQSRVENMGARTYFVSRIPFGFRYGRLPENIRVRKYLTEADAEYLRSACPSLEYRSAETTSCSRSSSRRWRARLSSSSVGASGPAPTSRMRVMGAAGWSFTTPPVGGRKAEQFGPFYSRQGRSQRDGGPRTEDGGELATN